MPMVLRVRYSALRHWHLEAINIWSHKFYIGKNNDDDDSSNSNKHLLGGRHSSFFFFSFSLSSFIFIKRLFSSSSLSSIRVVSSAYLRLLIFLLAILIPACDSSTPAFHMMYSAYKLNKQGENIQPCHTLFSVLYQSIVPCPVLTVASWPHISFSGDR